MTWAEHYTQQARIMRATARRYRRLPEWAEHYRRLAAAAERLAAREETGK